jgi:hypothetical protein
MGVRLSRCQMRSVRFLDNGLDHSGLSPAPSSRSTCRTSLAAVRPTQTCHGPMTSRVAHDSSDMMGVG